MQLDILKWDKCTIVQTTMLALAVTIGLGVSPQLSANTTAGNAPKQYQIPASDLGQVLNEFAQQAGIAISFDAKLVNGKNSPGLSTVSSTEQAVIQLLAGTGLRAVRSASGYRLEALPKTPGPLVLAPITVKGELQERTLQDTQTSVVVETGEQLERRSDANLFEIIERTAGVNTGTNGRDVVIRGIQSNGFGFGGGKTINTRVDGASVSSTDRFSIRTSTWDLEQIEILRGPQSTQSGRNALAGAIEIRSKDPVHEFEAKVRGEIGNAGTFGGALAINTPIIEDTLAFRFTVDRDQSDGFIDNPTRGEDYQQNEQTTIRGSVLFEPNDQFWSVLKYVYYREERGSETLLGPSFPDERVNPSNDPASANAKGNTFNFRATYQINDAFSIENESTYLRTDADVLSDSDAGPADLGTSFADNDARLFEQELKLRYQSERLNYVVGAFYTDIKGEDIIDALVPASALSPALPATSSILFKLNRDTDTENYAFFGEADYIVSPQLTLTLGARYDRETVEDLSSSALTSDDPLVASLLPPSAPPEATSDTFDAFLPKVGLVYDVSQDMSLGFTVQRGYRAGGAEINIEDGELDSFDPEFTWNYELSLRSQWYDGRLTVNANAFYTDWQDQQVSVISEGLTVGFSTQNAGTSRLYGGELEITAQPTDQLDLFVSLGYSDNEFTDFVANGVQLAGNEFPYGAKFTGAFGGTYYFTDNLYLSVDASYADSAFGDIQNTELTKIDGRFLANARFGYETDDWAVWAYVDNAFDKGYATRIFNTTIGRQGTITAGDPRTYGVIAQYQF